jgi:hypothetical protein
LIFAFLGDIVNDMRKIQVALIDIQVILSENINGGAIPASERRKINELDKSHNRALCRGCYRLVCQLDA